MYSTRNTKEWSFARKFYELARRLVPENGHPFNQLAVIDAFNGDEFLALERYCRR